MSKNIFFVMFVFVFIVGIELGSYMGLMSFPGGDPYTPVAMTIRMIAYMSVVTLIFYFCKSNQEVINEIAEKKDWKLIYVLFFGKRKP